MSESEKISELRRDLEKWRSLAAQLRDEKRSLARQVGMLAELPVPSALPVSLAVRARHHYDALMALALETYDGDRELARNNFDDYLLGFIDAALADSDTGFGVDVELLRAMLAIDNERLTAPRAPRKSRLQVVPP